MSELTLRQLLAADPRPFAEAALAWQQWAEQVDNTAEMFIRTAQDLGDAWPEGMAAQGAHARADSLKAELSGAYQPARQIGQALRRLADAMVLQRDWAQAVVAAARAHGLVVDVASGGVTASQDLLRSGSPEGAVRLVNSYANELNALVERARGLDDEIAREIAKCVPNPLVGFGTVAPPPVDRAEVESRLGLPPDVVHRWWQSLTPLRQEQVIADFPELVGWLDGVPAADRDFANRLRLDNELADLRQRAAEINQRIEYLESSGQVRKAIYELRFLRRELYPIEQELARLDRVGTALAGLGDRGMLLGYDTAGDGKVVVAVGNPDTARHVAVWVPGMGTELEDVQSNVNRVVNLQESANDLTPEIDGDVATIMWLGYDAPEMDLSVITDGRSEEGGKALDSFVDGLNISHGGGEHTMTAIGHSYGSTVVAEAALRGDGLAVRDIVVAGSPGMHTDHAADLDINPQHVWAGSAVNDPVSDTRGHIVARAAGTLGAANPWFGAVVPGAVSMAEKVHGVSPHEMDFGANRFHVDTTGHSDYWKKDSESLLNQAFIVMGQYDGVILDHGRPPT